MAAPIPLSQMMTSVRRRSNTENQTGFITDPEVRELLNYGLSDLWDLLVKARAQEFYRKTFLITTVTNTSAYALPSDFYELISVDVSFGGNMIVNATPYMEAERNRYRWYPGWAFNLPVYYRLLGATSQSAIAQINFIPTPGTSVPVTLNYYPAFVPFATDGSQDASTFDGVQGWEEYAIWMAVAALKAKEDLDPSFAMARMSDLRQRLEGLAADRDAGASERVHDVLTDKDSWGWGWGNEW